MSTQPLSEVLLIDLARAEDFTDEEFLDCFAETSRERDIIDKLKGPGAHLLEGPRGVGKSSLLKKAELELDESFQESRCMGVYVNFKASLLLQADPKEIGADPFLCWLAAKVLDALYKKCRKLGVITSELLADKYRKLLGVTQPWDPGKLERIVSDLQSLATAQVGSEKQEILSRLTAVDPGRFANIESVTEFVQSLVGELKLTRVIFLFDEAAHTFDENQQKTFFQFFKLLHGGVISAKAATYPGITTYGGNFEIGHDAIKIAFSAFEENSTAAQEALRSHFREMLKKRVPGAQFGKLVQQGEALDLLILLSHGNPRLFLQTVSKWLTSGELSKRSALSCSNDYIANELINYHLGLKQRLPRFASHISLGLDLVKAHLVPELQKKNMGKGESPKVQTIYFTLDANVPHKVIKTISLLQYSGFVFAKSVVKIAKRRQAPRYALHLGVAANDKVFHSSLSRDPDKAIKILSLADYREFYGSDPRFQELIDNHQETDRCPNEHPRESDGPFCPTCGARFPVDNVIVQLLDDPVGKLALTDFLKRKLTEDFNAGTIRAVLSLTESDLQTARMIGPKRSRMIVNAAEEYISG